MGCYQCPYVEQLRGMLASAGDQYKSAQLAPAVLHTACTAYALSMERRATRKGSCQTPTLFSEDSIHTCGALNSRKCGRRPQATQCAPPHHTSPAQPPPPGLQTRAQHPTQCPLTTPGVLVAVASAGGSPICCERSQLRATHSNPTNDRRGQGEPTQGQTRRLKQPKRHFSAFWPKHRNPRLGWFGRLR